MADTWPVTQSACKMDGEMLVLGLHYHEALSELCKSASCLDN